MNSQEFKPEDVTPIVLYDLVDAEHSDRVIAVPLHQVYNIITECLVAGFEWALKFNYSGGKSEQLIRYEKWLIKADELKHYYENNLKLLKGGK